MWGQLQKSVLNLLSNQKEIISECDFHRPNWQSKHIQKNDDGGPILKWILDLSSFFYIVNHGVIGPPSSFFSVTWFDKVFPKEQLTVVCSTPFATKNITGITMEEFLLSAPTTLHYKDKEWAWLWCPLTISNRPEFFTNYNSQPATPPAHSS